MTLYPQVFKAMGKPNTRLSLLTWLPGYTSKIIGLFQIRKWYLTMDLSFPERESVNKTIDQAVHLGKLPNTVAKIDVKVQAVYCLVL